MCQNEYLWSKWLTPIHTISSLNDPHKEQFENIVAKEKNAGNQHLSIFTQCILPIS